MPVSSKVGSFVARSGTGTQAVTGLGFTPKALIVWTSGSRSASGTWQAEIWQSFGFSTGPTNSHAVGTYAFDGGQADTARRHANKLICITGATQGFAEADLLSFDADGFTVNWTLQPTTHAWQMNYLALGGSDITGAKVVTYTNPLGGTTKAVTGVGFSPDLILNVGAYLDSAVPSTGTSSFFTLGVVNKHGQQWSLGLSSSDAINPSNGYRRVQTDAAILHIADTAIMTEAHFSSMDADGFSFRWSTSGQANQINFALCLKGVSSKAGAFAKSGAAAPAAQTLTRVGFTPRAVLLASVSAVVSSTSTQSAAFAVGASDGTTQRASAQRDEFGQNPAWADSVHSDVGLPSTTSTNSGVPSTTTVTSVTAFNADGFALSHSPNTTLATEVLYLAIGDAGVNTLPSTVAP